MKKITFLIGLVMLMLGVNAQVFITELADPDNNANVRYIELYNAGSTDVDFTENSGWRIDKYTNASATVSQTLSLTGTITAGGFYIIATGTDDGEFLTVYGVSADQFDGAADNVAGSNGDDNLELYDGNGVLIDQFGVPGEDGTGKNHEFEDGRAERADTVTVGKPLWNVLEWTIDNDAPAGDGPQNAPDGFDPRAWIGAGASSASITWNISTFTEAVANDGSFSAMAPIVVDIANETFALTMVNMTENTHYTVTNLPAGLGLEIISATGTSANIILTGNATNHADANDISDLTITFLDPAFTGGDASVVGNSSKSDIVIDFMDAPEPQELTWSTGTFSEAAANDGSISNTIALGLISDSFTTVGTLTSGVDYNVTNLPAGLSLDITTSSLTEAVVMLTGAADVHDNLNDVSDLTITFLDAAFVGADASSVLNATKSDLIIDYIDPYVIPDLMITEIMYNNPSTDSLEFIEIYNNESTDVNLNGYTMVGVTHTFGNVVIPANGFYVLCLDASAMLNVFGVTVDEWTEGSLLNSSEEVAIYTAEGNLVDNVIYEDGSPWPDADGSGHSIVACVSGGNDNATDWYKSTTYVTEGLWASPMQADLICTTTPNLTWGSSIFNEAAADDGSIDNTIALTLADDEFATLGALVLGTDFSVANVPLGLTVEILTTSTTEAIVSLTGNADSHLNSDDISNMEITFNDAAFISDYASNVGNYSKTDISVDFISVTVITLTWNESTFNESASNDGTMGNEITVVLENETFSSLGDFVSGTQYTYSNAPAGLSVEVFVSSSTEAVIAIEGAADSHLDTDDINNLTVTFLNAAFTGDDASVVVGAENANLIVNFDDPTPSPELTWNESAFNEAMTNDGSIDNSITATLTNETFTTIGVLTSGADYMAMNVPTGLTIEVETTSDSEVQISLTGMADSHLSTDNVTDLSIAFTNAAYSGGDASLITNNQNSTISVVFMDPFIVPGLVISEIMYNSPESDTDSLEFIEIYNNDVDDINLTGYYMAGVSYTFPNLTLLSGDYIVIGYNSMALQNTFGVTAAQWIGALSNDGEGIAIYNPGGELVDTVFVDDATWPSTDGGGHSMVLCDYDSDNNVPANWLVSTNYVMDNADGAAIWASPAAIDLVCTTSPEITWDVTTFMEATDNDGSIATSANLVLTDDAFASVGTLVEGTDYNVANVPTGLTVEIVTSSTTEATIALTGNATSHDPADDISDMEITFTDAAFASDFASSVLGSSKTDLVVDFDDFVSISEFDNTGVSIYPNPSKGQFKIDAQNVTLVEVTDIAGKLIISSNKKDIFEITNANTGVYFVKVYQENAITTHKLIVE